MQDTITTENNDQEESGPTIAPIGDEELNFRLREYIKTYNETLKRHAIKLNSEIQSFHQKPSYLN